MNISKHDLFIAFDNLFKYIPKYNLVLAFSGNKDSVVLGNLLVQWIRQYAPYWKLRLVHFVHGDARSDLLAAKIAEDFAMENELCLEVATHHIQNESAGAAFRKQYFNESINRETEVVVTGHHLSDSVETTLINLFSGSGIKGASGISYNININGVVFLRPFIAARCYQEEIDNLASLLLLDEDVHYVYDEMNFNTQMKRNAVREDILPKIEKAFPNIQEKIFEFSKVMAEQTVINEYLFKIVDSKLSVGQDMYSETLILEMIEKDPEVFNMWFFIKVRNKYSIFLTKRHLKEFLIFLKNHNYIKMSLPFKKDVIVKNIKDSLIEFLD